MNASTITRLVAAENYHAKIANQFLPAIFEAVPQFLNQKIKLEAGGTSKAFREKVSLPEQFRTAEGSYIFYFDSSEYTASVMVRTSFPVDDKWETVERRYYLADLTKGVMMKSYPYDKQAETWDFGVVQGRLFKIEALQEQIRQIRSSLPEKVQYEIPRN